MVIENSSLTCTGFAGTRQIASGDLLQVAFNAQESIHRDSSVQILIFDDVTSQVIELDLRGTPEELSQRIAKLQDVTAGDSEPAAADEGARKPGRPKLGVVAREITLLPRHWDWLATQPGGASVALRKLVEQAKRANQGKDRLRAAQEAAYRFMSAMAGNEPGFEEASRALFAGDQARFETLVEPWPIDVGNHAKKLAGRAFNCIASETKA
jgi:hypothetical protein